MKSLGCQAETVPEKYSLAKIIIQVSGESTRQLFCYYTKDVLCKGREKTGKSREGTGKRKVVGFCPLKIGIYIILFLILAKYFLFTQFINLISIRDQISNLITLVLSWGPLSLCLSRNDLLSAKRMG